MQRRHVKQRRKDWGSSDFCLHYWKASRFFSIRLAMSMLISVSTRRDKKTSDSVIKPGSGSTMANTKISPPYRYFRFFVMYWVFRMPTLTSRTMYIGKVKIRPHRRRLSPIVEKNVENSYSGGRFNRLANMKSIRMVIGTMYMYPMNRPKRKRLTKAPTNLVASPLSCLCNAGLMNL